MIVKLNIAKKSYFFRKHRSTYARISPPKKTRLLGFMVLLPERIQAYKNESTLYKQAFTQTARKVARDQHEAILLANALLV